ncbi:hypothetical protein Tco_0003233 [Tanacetum coccineum]
MSQKKNSLMLRDKHLASIEPTKRLVRSFEGVTIAQYTFVLGAAIAMVWAMCGEIEDAFWEVALLITLENGCLDSNEMGLIVWGNTDSHRHPVHRLDNSSIVGVDGLRGLNIVVAADRLWEHIPITDMVKRDVEIETVGEHEADQPCTLVRCLGNDVPCTQQFNRHPNVLCHTMLTLQEHRFQLVGLGNDGYCFDVAIAMNGFSGVSSTYSFSLVTLLQRLGRPKVVPFSTMQVSFFHRGLSSD